MKHLISCILTIVLFCQHGVYAGESSPKLVDIAEKKEATQKIIEEMEQTASEGPYDEFNRLTPRSSLFGLSQAFKNKDYQTAQNYLDLRKNSLATGSTKSGAELSRKLHIIARHVLSISLEDLSDSPKGNLSDGLPKYRDLIDTITTSNGDVSLYMQHVPRGDGVYVWKVSNKTVAQIPTLYQEFGYGFVGDWLSEHLQSDYEILGMEIWQILMLFVLGFLSYIGGVIITFPVIKFIQYKAELNVRRVKKFLVGPLRFFIAVLLFRSYFDVIVPSQTAQAIFQAKTLFIFATVWILLNLVEFIINRFAERMKQNGQENPMPLLRPVATIVKIIILLIGIVLWLHNMGFEVTAVITGLGVGSIALALAAQKTLENLLGSITVYIAQPVRVGDFCKFGTSMGTVESIGLRSTQIRTPARTVIHVPNALFANDSIENLTQRDKILYRTRIRLAYDVSPTQIRAVLQDIRTLMDRQDHIDEKARVRFIEFGEYAQELELYAHMKTDDFILFLEYIEQFNLDIVDILASHHVSLAIPSNKTYLEKSGA